MICLHSPAVVVMDIPIMLCATADGGIVDGVRTGLNRSHIVYAPYYDQTCFGVWRALWR
jgi:hypothetical protein